MRTPTIHMNGTSKEELVRQLCDAGAALDGALRVLAEAAPNGRDYYPQGAGAIREATEEHVARCQRLRDVYDELTMIVAAIDAA